MKQKLFVFMIDALCESDVGTMRALPNFWSILDRGALVEEVLPVYPSFTYPCHTSIMTGCYPDRHGIPHNEMVKAGAHPVPWYTKRAYVKEKLFVEYAKDAGYSTCLINWPVSAGADVDWNLPMVIPMMYRGDDPLQFYEGCATGELLDRYFWKYGHMLRGLNREIHGSLDSFTSAVAPDILRDCGQPDVMFVKMCDLDTIRHKLGVDTEPAREQLKKHDCELGVLMESIRRFGDFENTNFVVMGDHGQTDVKRVLNFNRVLQNAGLLELDADGRLRRFDAYCHSVGISGWIELRDPADEKLRERVYRVLLDARDGGGYDLQHIFTKEEAREIHRLAGPFDFVIECDPPMSFGFTPSEPLFRDAAPGDYKTAMAGHGGLPALSHRTTFFAAGPNVRPGAVVRRACLVDEAPTMAKMLGFSMPGVDGRVLEEILR
ncbi:MAG: alkaline phosphatase family protein [Clostridiales bacterium]|nr:alkaline phosphatase family protein [Clostridiales bacterium]